MEPLFEIEHRTTFQHGLVTRQQLHEAGATRRKRRTLLASGVLHPVGSGVYRAVGASLSWRQALLAACLAAGPEAVASHRAAAVVWGLIDPPAPVEITLPYAHHPLPAGTVRHRTRTFRDQDRARRDGIPVTAPARTLLDLGAVLPLAVPDAVERCLHSGLLSTAALWQILAEIGGPGRRGCRPLRRALEHRALAEQKPHSLLESVMAEVLVRTGVRFEYQVPLILDGRRYRLDFALPSLKLACEADGLAAHSSRQALDSDLERQNRLVAHGWMVLRYTSTHLRRRATVRTEIVKAVEERRRLFAASASLTRRGREAATPSQRVG